MIKRFTYIFAAIISLSGLASCSFKKSLPEGAYRYNGAKVKVETEADSIQVGTLPTELTYALQPKTNAKFLGIPFRLAIYNLFYNKEKDKVTFLKNMAQEPVLYSKELTGQVEDILESVAFNNGFFNPEVSHEVQKNERLRKVFIKYRVKVNPPYRVQKITYDVERSKISDLINGRRPGTVLKIGEPYDLNTLRVERKRIASFMKSKGYYYFEDSMLEFTADTSYAERSIHLVLKVKPEIPAQALRPYKMGTFRIFPDYVVSEGKDAAAKDSLVVGDFHFIYNEQVVKPEILRDAVTLQPGELYDPLKHQATLKRLSNLNTFKYFSVRFEQLPNNDTLLDVRILLTPKIKRTIEAELGASFKSQLFFTPEMTVNYINRNLFRGSETLKISGIGAFNLPLNDTLSYNDRYQLVTTVQKPGLWSPFDILKFSDKTVGNTQGKLDLERQSFTLRFTELSGLFEEEYPDVAEFLAANPDFVPAFSLMQANVSFGYNWRKRDKVRHQLNPLSFGYQRSNFSAQDPAESELILVLALLSSTPQIALSLGDMFYYSPDYIFNLDTRLEKYRRDNYLLRARVAFSGNRIIGDQNDVLPEQAFQSQYFTLEPDFRYLAVYTPKSSLAFRLAPAAILPFNKDVVLPFFDLYSVGGPSSNRAFVPRTVGPGSTPPDKPAQFPFAGIGNLKLETNIEYRYQVTSLIELAAFVDAGNVWQIYDATDNFQAVFRWNRFYKQLAVGAGLGFRFDFDVLLLRFDLAVPLTKPYLSEAERFVGNQINLGSRAYRRDNLQFNFAFGYPF